MGQGLQGTVDDVRVLESVGCAVGRSTDPRLAVWRFWRQLIRPFKWLVALVRRWLDKVNRVLVAGCVRALQWLLKSTTGGQLRVVVSGGTVAPAAKVGPDFKTSIAGLSDIGCEVLHKALAVHDRSNIPGMYIKPEEVGSLATTVGKGRQLPTMEQACEELRVAGYLAMWEESGDMMAVWVLLSEMLWNKSAATEVVYLLQDELVNRGVWDF